METQKVSYQGVEWKIKTDIPAPMELTGYHSTNETLSLREVFARKVA
jgi:hypothetical protein